MCHVFVCPLTICNLTEMWDKERDISIQFLDLMETDFIEIFRVKTWLLLVAKSRLGLQVTKLLHVEPHQPRPPTACARPRPDHFSIAHIDVCKLVVGDCKGIRFTGHQHFAIWTTSDRQPAHLTKVTVQVDGAVDGDQSVFRNDDDLCLDVLSGTDDSASTLRVAGNAEWSLREGDMTVFHDHTLFVSLDDPDDILAQSRLGLRTRVVGGFSLNAQINARHDSSPPAGIRENDLEFLLGVGYSKSF